MMHLQANPRKTAPTCPKSPRSESQPEDSPSPKFRPPPGLELLEPETKPEKPKATRLSLASLFGPEEPKKIMTPPGLEKVEGLSPPPGLSLPNSASDWLNQSLNGIESDDTGTGGQRSDDSGQSDGEQAPGPTIVLALAERNQLKASSPMFQPMLSPGTASALMQRTPLRTKLQSKAGVFVPGAATAGAALPYVPMAAVNESWQKWHMRNSMHGDGSEYYGQDDYEYYSEQEGVSSYESMTDFYSEPEWPYVACQ